MEVKEILRKCDHTLLSQTATWAEIKAICDDGMKYHTASVCIPASYVRQAKGYVGDKLPIVGNVDPVEVMMLGSIEDVYKAVRCCIEDAYDSPKGYLLSTGCGIPINSPIENIDALMDAGRKYGKWPININNFDEEEKIIKSTVK